MQIELYLKDRCRNSRILYTTNPVESIRTVRETSQYGPDKISKVSSTVNELFIPAGGMVSLELTATNAVFILDAVDNELLEFVVDDQRPLVEAMLKPAAGAKTSKKKKSEDDLEEQPGDQEAKPPAAKVISL